MADRWYKYKKCDDYRVQAPKSVLDAVEIKSIAENGIFEVGAGGIFSKVYMFSDVNFATASVDEQIGMLESWCRWLNSNNERFKITFNNKNRDMQKFKNDILFHRKMDVFDDLRDGFNEIIEDRILEGRQGIEQELYITITTKSVGSYEDAKTYFNSLEINMERDFKDIGSQIKPLNAEERLRILHDVYRFGREEEFRFHFDEMIEKYWDFKERIAPSRLDFTVSDTYFIADSKFLAGVYIKNYPAQLSDRYLTKLFSLNVKMIGSIDITPISREDVEARLKSLYMGVQRNIRKQGKKKLQEKDFESEISYSTQMDRDDIKQIIDEVRNKEQHIFWTDVVLIVIADSLDKLKKDIELIKRTSSSDSVVIDNIYSMQKEALNTVLPIGVKQVEVGVPLETKSLAALFPFNVQELLVKNGNWYGINKVSKNLCIGNRKALVNGNGFYFGVPGSGKSSACKMDAIQTFLKTDDDIIIIDPKGDWFKPVRACNGVEIELSSTAPHHVNPLAAHNIKNRSNIADEKAEIVLAILTACKKEPLTAPERSITNRCLKYLYKDELLGITDTPDNDVEKTLTDLYYKFDEIINDENAREVDISTAEDLKLYLELFVTGSLNIFAQPNNVDIYNRFLCFNLSNLGKAMRDLGMLVMVEHIKERIRKNFEENRVTHLYIDEFHELLLYDEIKIYLNKLWKEIRFLGGFCTGITQNVGDVLEDDITVGMLENSEFVMILKQNQASYEKLINVIGISAEQVKYITSESGSGRGLLKCGPTIVPIDMTIPEDSELFDVIDTNPHRKFEQSTRK